MIWIFVELIGVSYVLLSGILLVGLLRAAHWSSKDWEAHHADGVPDPA